MYDSVFSPRGPTYFVDENAAVQALCVPARTGFQSYRIRNLTGAATYIAYSTPSIVSGIAPTMSKPTAPISGTSTAQALGMQVLGVEVFTLPVGCWFLAAAGATFEVTPGEGQ